MALSVSEFLKLSEEKLRQEIEGIPAKVAAMSTGEIADEHDRLANNNTFCDPYTVAYFEALADRYFDELGKIFAKSGIVNPEG